MQRFAIIKDLIYLVINFEFDQTSRDVHGYTSPGAHYDLKTPSIDILHNPSTF